MRQLKLLLNISELLSRFKFQVGILNASSLLDINIIAEDFFIPILNEIFDCDLKNANLIAKNYPAVDLIDEINKITIQITATSSSKKVRETLEKIVTNNFHEKYNKIFILIITTKQAEYNSSMLSSATQGKFQFTNENVIDIEGLFSKIKSLSLEKIKLIENYLKCQYTDIETTNNILNKNLPHIKNKLGDFQNKFLKSKLEASCNARQEWYEKKAFFEGNLPSISDLNQKFSVEKNLKECNQKIELYENEIILISNQIYNE
jgi:hypothetical protein